MQCHFSSTFMKKNILENVFEQLFSYSWNIVSLCTISSIIVQK